MDFRDGTRAQSIQLGAMLLFGILILFAAGYQAFAVPAQNAGFEQDHSELVQDQMQEVRTGIHVTAATGSSSPASVQMGVRYPSRTLFLNPTPGAGTLETGEPSTVSFENVAAIDDGANEYWNEPDEYNTRSLIYRPNYNHRDDPPRTVYESTILYNSFQETDIAKSGQRIVSGNEISLVMLNGTYQESSSGSVSVTPSALSAPTRTVSVRPDNGPITVTIDNVGLDEEEVQQLFADEPHEVECSPGDGDCGTLEIELDGYETYKLRISEVGIGPVDGGPAPRYMTAIDGDDATVPDGTSQRIVVEVRDKYNAPVSGVSVEGDITGIGELKDKSKTTNDDGRATFVYEAPDSEAFSGSESVDITLEVNDEDIELTATVHVFSRE